MFQSQGVPDLVNRHVLKLHDSNRKGAPDVLEVA